MALTDEMLTTTPWKVGVGLPLVDHPAGHQLRQEIRTFEIDADQSVEALLGRVENVGPHVRRDAGVVHQHVEPAEPLPHGVDNGLPVRGLRDVALTVDRVGAALLERVEGTGHVGRVANAVDRQVEPAVGQRLGDAQPDPAASAGHQRHSFLCLAKTTSLTFQGKIHHRGHREHRGQSVNESQVTCRNSALSHLPGTPA